MKCRGKKLFFYSLFLILVFFPSLTEAHLPRIVETNFTEVQDSEVSQAFYGQLTGEPNFFKIDSGRPFKFYVGILVPDIKDAKKDISVDITKNLDEKENKTFKYLLDGLKFNWEKFYEPFGGDSYWQGPEVRNDAAAGIYNIRVFSQNNFGKYVLVVGEKEEISGQEMLSTIKTLPKLKKDFFGKSPLTAYFNYIGLFMLVFILSMVLIVLLSVWIYKIIKRYVLAVAAQNKTL